MKGGIPTCPKCGNTELVTYGTAYPNIRRQRYFGSVRNWRGEWVKCVRGYSDWQTYYKVCPKCRTKMTLEMKMRMRVE